MLLYEFTSPLNERATAILYHYTKIDAAAKILSTKQFKLTSSYPNDDEHLNGNNELRTPYFLSTARTPYNAFMMIRQHIDIGVIFDLNGDEFNRRGIKVQPVDYFQGASPEKKEHEDRVFSKEPTISTEKLITGVHIFAKSLMIEPRSILTVLVESAKSGIPTYIYDDFRAFMLQNKAKTLNLNQVIEALKVTLKHGNNGNKQSTEITDNLNAKIQLRAIHNLITAKQPDDLTPETIWIFDKTLYDQREGAQDVKSIFRKVMQAPNQAYGKKLIQLVKSTGIPFNQVFEKLANKWFGLSYMVDTRSGKNPFVASPKTSDEDSIF